MSKPPIPVYDSEHPLAPQTYAWLILNEVASGGNLILENWTGDISYDKNVSDYQKQITTEDDRICLELLASGAGWLGGGDGDQLTYWFACWFKVSDMSGSVWFVSDNDYNAFKGNGGFIGFYMNGGTSYVGTIPISQDVWYHLLVSSLNNVISIYIDGVLDFSQDLSTDLPTGFNHNRMFELFKGFVDSYYYSAGNALDALESADLYENHWAAFGGTGSGVLEITVTEPEIIISETIRKSLSTKLTDALDIEESIARMYTVFDSIDIEENHSLEKFRPPIELEVYDDLMIEESIHKNSLRHLTLSDSLIIHENTSGTQLNYTDPISPPTIPPPTVTNPNTPQGKEIYGC